MIKYFLIILVIQYFILKVYNAENNRIVVSKMDVFPHNLDEDFAVNLHHPNLEYHHFYAVIMSQVICKEISQIIYLYPGFNSYLSRIKKEKYYHVTKLKHSRFITNLVFRFFRESHGCQFEILYSKSGAKQLETKQKFNQTLILSKTISLFKKPILKLEIKSEDGHQHGLSLNMKAFINCTAQDGYPLFPAMIDHGNSMRVIKSYNQEVHVKIIEFQPTLQDHLTYVTCKSDTVVIRKQIFVFHHAEQVAIMPINTKYFTGGQQLECKSLGRGYPISQLNFNIAHLNKSMEKHFKFVQDESDNSITATILPGVPMLSNWTFNCSSINMIPPMDKSGPFKLLNITIGEDPVKAHLAQARMWTMTLVIVVIAVVFIVGLICIISRVKCTSRHFTGTYNTDENPNQYPTMRQRLSTFLSRYVGPTNKPKIEHSQSDCLLVKSKESTVPNAPTELINNNKPRASAPNNRFVRQPSTNTQDATGDAVKFYCTNDEFVV